jgi:antitoxin component YwqK of YwqJK toxin-antitoxin module
MVAVYDEDLLYSMEDGIYVYEGEPYTGIAHRFSPVGALIAEDHFIDGLQEGASRYWYPSGELCGEEYFLHNSLHGPCKEWYPNGQLKRDAVYEYGIRVSDKQWDASGRLVEAFQLTEKDPYFMTLELRRRSHEKNGAA